MGPKGERGLQGEPGPPGTEGPEGQKVKITNKNNEVISFKKSFLNCNSTFKGYRRSSRGNGIYWAFR